MDSLSDQVKADLLALPPRIFVGKWLFSTTPHIFAGNQLDFLQYREKVSQLLEVDAYGCVFIGSAAIGLSLNPQHSFTPYGVGSDVDLAIVSPYHFDAGWRWLRRLGAGYYSLPGGVRHWVDEHRKRLVYWGAIATDKILPYLPFGKEWVNAQEVLKAEPASKDRAVNFRVYRDSSALMDYQLNGLQRVRDELLALGAKK